MDLSLLAVKVLCWVLFWSVAILAQASGLLLFFFRSHTIRIQLLSNHSHSVGLNLHSLWAAPTNSHLTSQQDCWGVLDVSLVKFPSNEKGYG